MCPVCTGRGEVESGITYGFVKTGEDPEGKPLGYPTRIRPNPAAMNADGNDLDSAKEQIGRTLGNSRMRQVSRNGSAIGA